MSEMSRGYSTITLGDTSSDNLATLLSATADTLSGVGSKARWKNGWEVWSEEKSQGEAFATGVLGDIKAPTATQKIVSQTVKDGKTINTVKVTLTPDAQTSYPKHYNAEGTLGRWIGVQLTEQSGKTSAFSKTEVTVDNVAGVELSDTGHWTSSDKKTLSYYSSDASADTAYVVQKDESENYTIYKIDYSAINDVDTVYSFTGPAWAYNYTESGGYGTGIKVLEENATGTGEDWVGGGNNP